MKFSLNRTISLSSCYLFRFLGQVAKPYFYHFQKQTRENLKKNETIANS